MDSPYLESSSPITFSSVINTFTETLGTNNQGAINYQVSTDNGVTWHYWSGSTWVVTTQTDGTETSSASDIDVNIVTLDTDGGDFLWRAFMSSDGDQPVELDQLDIIFDDITPPSTPSTPDLQTGSDTGTSNSDDKTADTTPSFDVTCTEADSTITLYADGLAVGTHICTAVGAATVSVSPAITDGIYDFTTSETDLAGNESPQSAPLEVEIDAMIDPVTINTPTTGSPVSGIAEANSTVVVTTASGATCTTTADVSGNYSCSLSPSPVDGEDVTAVSTDEYGNTTNTTETGGIDSSAPTSPTIDVVTSGDTTITGTGEDGTTITLNIGACTNAPVIITGGVWSCDIDPSNASVKGETIIATSTDSAGNFSTGSYTIPKPRKGGSITYTCKDTSASNYNAFGRHKQSKCKYDTPPVTTLGLTPTESNPFGGEQCPAHLLITDNMKNGDTNGVYSPYNQGVVTEISILQAHINRLLADEYTQAAGPVDKWFRSKTKLGVERIQAKLNQLL